MVVQHNLQAMNTQRQFGLVNRTMSKTTEKLSSGYKINRAADDAAGLAISEKMRRQIRGLTQASTNCQDGISFSQVADGALNEVHDMLQRINELSVKAANGTLTSDDRAYIDSEVQQIKDEMGRVFETTSFNERLIFVEPYVPEITQVSDEIDFQIFNGENGQMGGIIANNVRYTWDELGLTDKMNADMTSFTESGSVEIPITPAPEILELSFEKGMPAGNVSRVYSWAADSTGIIINNNTNNKITWAEMGMTGEPVQPGKYSFSYNGTDISFFVTEGGSFEDVQNGINGVGKDTPVSWKTKPVYVSTEDATFLKGYSDTISATSDNYSLLFNTGMQVRVRSNIGATIPNYGISVQTDGLSYANSLVSWADLETVSGEHRITDWGRITEHVSTETLDDSETYTYTDPKSGFEFSFGLSDEVSIDAVIESINGSTLKRDFYASSDGSTSGTIAYTVAGATLHEGSVVGNTGSTDITVSNTDLSFGLQNILGRSPVYEDVELDNELKVTPTSNGYEISYKIKGALKNAEYKATVSEAEILRAVQNGGESSFNLKLSNADALLASATPEEINDGLKGIANSDKEVTVSIDFSGMSSDYNANNVTRTAKYESDMSTLLTTGYTDISDSIPTSISGNAAAALPINPEQVYRYYKQEWSGYSAGDAKNLIGRYMQQMGYKTGIDDAAQATIDANWDNMVNNMYSTLKNLYEDENDLTDDYTADLKTINNCYKSVLSNKTSTDLDTLNQGIASVDFTFSLKNTSNYSTKFDFELTAPDKEMYIQAGSEAGQHIDMSWKALNKTTLGIGRTNVLTAADASSAILEVKDALSIISEARTNFGAYQNRFEHTINNLDNVVENTTSAESQIRDTDMAKEMVNYSLMNILSQAGTAMLAQANQSNQGVLSLLQ